MRCDVIALGILAAAKTLARPIPIVVRLAGKKEKRIRESFSILFRWVFFFFFFTSLCLEQRESLKEAEKFKKKFNCVRYHSFRSSLGTRVNEAKKILEESGIRIVVAEVLPKKKKTFLFFSLLFLVFV